jgi:hypothetical protein
MIRFEKKLGVKEPPKNDNASNARKDKLEEKGNDNDPLSLEGNIDREN